jgi:phosphoglucomutase
MQAEAGVAISASHNPPQYNGLKIFDSTGMAYTMEQQERLEGLIHKGEYTTSDWNHVGRVEVMDLKRIYIEAVSEIVEAPLEKRLVCDLFNGATTSIAKELFEELGCETILINAQPDGHFPAGNPEPNKESLKRLGKLIRETGAEIGFGFDGDGDRMMPVDENGEIPSPDRVLAAYAGYPSLPRRYPLGSKVDASLGLRGEDALPVRLRHPRIPHPQSEGRVPKLGEGGNDGLDIRHRKGVREGHGRLHSGRSPTSTRGRLGANKTLRHRAHH